VIRLGRTPLWLSWSRILSAAARSYPAGGGLQGVKCRSKLFWRLARDRTSLGPWLEKDSNASLRRRIEMSPALLGFCVWPYIHSGWSVDRRFDALFEHERIVDQVHPLLALAEGDCREVLSLAHLVPGLRLELDRSPGFFREGGLAFHLCLHEHRLISVAFSLAREQGDLVAYVGAIQGSNRQDAMAIYRQLTKTLHGLRPRDFVLRAFQLLAGALGVTKLLCVADQYRHQHHPYFSDRLRARIHLPYDDVWRENGGRPLSSGFFELSVTPAYRGAEEVPSRKRAMYRRRSQMLVDLDRALQCELHLSAVAAARPVGIRPANRFRASIGDAV
jgi:uncharacterized protein VirK/YbjX